MLRQFKDKLRMLELFNTNVKQHLFKIYDNESFYDLFENYDYKFSVSIDAIMEDIKCDLEMYLHDRSDMDSLSNVAIRLAYLFERYEKMKFNR